MSDSPYSQAARAGRYMERYDAFTKEWDRRLAAGTPEAWDIDIEKFLAQYHLKKGAFITYQAFDYICTRKLSPMPLMKFMIDNQYIDLNNGTVDKILGPHHAWIMHLTNNKEQPGYKDLMMSMVTQGFTFNSESMSSLIDYWAYDLQYPENNIGGPREPLELMKHLFASDFDPYLSVVGSNRFHMAKSFCDLRRAYFATRSSENNHKENPEIRRVRL